MALHVISAAIVDDVSPANRPNRDLALKWSVTKSAVSSENFLFQPRLMLELLPFRYLLSKNKTPLELFFGSVIHASSHKPRKY